MIKALLRNTLGSYYFKLVRIYWILVSKLYPLFIKRQNILVYAGVNIGDSFQKIHFKFKRVVGFEPNPENFKKIKHYNSDTRIDIFNLALSSRKGTSKFFLPDNKNNDASASLSDFSSNNRYQARKVINVETVNLSDFLKKMKVEKIDLYISDIEGYDYTVLKTIEENFIKTKKIKKLQVEAINNNEKNHYKSVTNFERDFDDLLSNHYVKIGRGSGIVSEGENFSGKTLDLLYKRK